MIYEKFRLRSSPYWIIVEPMTSSIISDKILVIDRRSGDFELRSSKDVHPLFKPHRDRVVYGIVGIFNSLVNRYLVVIQKRTSLGKQFLGEEVFRVDKFELISMVGSFDPAQEVTDFEYFENKPVIRLDTRGRRQDSPYSSIKRRHLSRFESNAELLYKTMMKNALSLKYFYFSYSLDITKRLQTQIRDDTYLNLSLSNAKTANHTFFWNRFLARDFRSARALEWVVPIMLGHINGMKAENDGKSVHIALISRCSCDRAGFRYARRGVDMAGNVATFVETEQIVTRGDGCSAFVQVRGSTPLVWNQKISLNFHPSIKIKESKGALEKHMRGLYQAYGNVLVLSLLKSIKWETPLNENLKKELNDMAYRRRERRENGETYPDDDCETVLVQWDFTREVDHQTFGRAQTFYDASIKSYVKAIGTFFCNSSVVEKVQSGVVRTHDLDCVDKTSVVQYVIANRVLADQLIDVGAIKTPTDMDPETAREFAVRSFRNQKDNNVTLAQQKLWYQASHQLSLIYTGGSAMKTFYIIKGYKGMFDGLEYIGSIRRFFSNNFLDGYRQDCVSILLGDVPVDPNIDLRKIQEVNIRLKVGQLIVGLFLLSLIGMIIGVIVPEKGWVRALNFFIFLGISGGCFGIFSTKVPNWSTIHQFDMRSSPMTIFDYYCYDRRASVDTPV